MRTVSKEAIQQLEFEEIIRLAKEYGRGPGSQNLFETLSFNSSVFELNEELLRVSELREVLSLPNSISISHYEAIDEDLFFLVKENYSLESDAVLRIQRILLNFQEIHSFFIGKRKKEYKGLHDYFEYEDFYSPLLSSISRVFDERGALKKDASPELARIFRIIASKEKEIDKVFNKILGDYKSKGLLSDNSESIKSGRRVLSLPAENKRIVKGIIHDESSSGKTVFIEPSGVIQVNNELIELENEKRKEVYKILKELSSELRVFVNDIKSVNDLVGYFDFLQCKAALAKHLNASRPELVESPCLELKKAVHPLLLHKEKSEDEFKVVPFDLHLKKDNRILLISGPNAGGKTVTLKAVGLIHLMTYAGFLVPIGEGSVIGDFHSIFTDIGDLQNLDEGLSTYSSHLESMNNIVKSVNERSLILIDEFGSGTDPKVGGAIAESILRRFNFLKAFGIVTTHYSSLKVFAYKEKGIVNGAMHFDEKELIPTYRLRIGAPGSSYAFEVAQKIGLHPALIKYARKKVGKKENAIENLLVDLQKEKAEYDDKLIEIYDEKHRLDQLIKTYERMSQELNIKRKKHKIRVKEEKLANIEKDKMKLDKVIKELTEEKRLEDAEKVKEQLVLERKAELIDIKSLKTEVADKRPKDYVFNVGDHVAFIDGEATGVIQSLQKKNAKILSGNMLMDVALSALKPIKDQLEINGRRKINIVTSTNHQVFSAKLDIRGYKYEDAARSIEEFLDGALMNNSNLLEVVHGKGSGALRRLLREKLREYRDVKKIWHPEEGAGGLGTTMIKF